MKKTFLLAIAYLCGGGILMAQNDGSDTDERVWFTDIEYSTTGVTNDGDAVMFQTWNTPYIIWSPRTGEMTEIGGVGPGNNVGGSGRFTDDGKTISAVMESSEIKVPTEWAKTVYDNAKGYTVNIISYLPENDHTLFAFAKTADNQKSILLRAQYSNGKTWRSGDVNVVPDPSVAESYVDGWEGSIECIGWLAGWMPLAGGHNGVFYISPNQGNQFNKVDPHPAGNTDAVDTYWAIDFLTTEVIYDPVNNGDLNKYGVIGLELEDGTGAVWYTEDATDSYHVATGVNGVPKSISHAGSVYYMATFNGIIQKSEDYGKTWTDVYSLNKVSPWAEGDAPLFTSIEFADDKNGMALGTGAVYVTTDGGANWKAVEVAEGTEAVIWNDVTFCEGKATVAGTGGNVYETTDMGQTWTKVEVEGGDGMDFYAVNDNVDAINVLGEDGAFFYRAYSATVTGYTAAIYDIESDTWTPLPGTGVMSGLTASSADDISGDGSTVVGGSYYNVMLDNSKVTKYNATAWTDGELIDLGNKFPDTERASKACKTSYDGSVIVGWQDHHGPWYGAVWRKNADGGYDMSLLPADPSMTEDDIDMSFTQEGYADMNSKLLGQCNAVSSDGKIIGGRGGTNYAVNGPWLWSEEKGLQLLYDEPYADYMVYDMTNDGTFVVGQAGQGGSSFIWTEETGFMEANLYVTTVLGIDLQGMSIAGIYDLSPNGRYITGWGMRGQGKVAYVLDLKGNTPTSIERDLEQTKAAVYPNPVSDELHVDLPFEGVKTRISLYSLQGSCVKSMTTTNTTNVINVSDVPTGLYILDVNANGTRKSFKLTINH